MFIKKFFILIASFLKKLKRLDYLIILIVFAIFSSLIISKIIKKTEWVTVGIIITNEEWWWQNEKQTSYWLAKDLSIGSFAKNTFGENIAEIIDKQTFEDGEGRKTVFVVLRLQSQFDKKRNLYLFNSEPLEVGKSINLSFGDQNVDGVISFFGEGLINDQVNLKITIKTKWVDYQVAEKINKSTVMSDESGRILAKVLDFKNEIHSHYEFSDIRGKSILVYDPKYRDVVMDLEVRAYKYGNNYYFIDGNKIGIGENMKLYFDTLSIGSYAGEGAGKIIDFEVL